MYGVIQGNDNIKSVTALIETCSFDLICEWITEVIILLVSSPGTIL